MIDPDMQLSPNFKLREFMSPDSHDVPDGVLVNLKHLAGAMEEIREIHQNRPITITSGYRTWAHHLAIYKALGKPESAVPRNSYHLRGLAADFVVKGVAPHITQELLKDWRGGMELAPTWTHCDLGPKRRFTL